MLTAIHCFYFTYILTSLAPTSCRQASNNWGLYW